MSEQFQFTGRIVAARTRDGEGDEPGVVITIRTYDTGVFGLLSDLVERQVHRSDEGFVEYYDFTVSHQDQRDNGGVVFHETNGAVRDFGASSI